MELKGRRALRAAGPGATPAEVEIPAEAPIEAPIEAVKPIEELIPAEAPAGVRVPAASPMAGPSEGRALKTLAPSAFSDEFADFGRQNVAALVQSQTALARGLETLGAELAGFALSGMDAAARTATDVLAVKTLADAIEVNAGFTRRSFDTLIGGSAKLSELGVKVAAETSQPILTQLGKGWTTAARFAFWPA